MIEKIIIDLDLLVKLCATQLGRLYLSIEICAYEVRDKKSGQCVI